MTVLKKLDITTQTHQLSLSWAVQDFLESEAQWLKIHFSSRWFKLGIAAVDPAVFCA